jgi:putative tryptophan/tyrosine transport system substrate-binding protein
MRRREFIAGLVGAATWPIAARAQQAVPVIGYLGSGLESDSFRVPPFRQGLNETGYVEGRNVTIEYRWAGDQYDHVRALVAELVGRKVAVIAVPGFAPAALAAKAATRTIPIVFSISGDPVALGLVASLNRPGGNVTGFSYLSTMLLAKRFELLHELLPKVTSFAALVNPENANVENTKREVQAAARALGLQLQVLPASNSRDVETAFATIRQQRVGALLVDSEALFTDQRDQILALEHVPADLNRRDSHGLVGGRIWRH